jgi:hypothetical protein
MKIQEQDLFHGAALTQIVEHKSFKALNRGSQKYGHYLVNKDQHVFVKYGKSNVTPWKFTFAPDEIEAIRGEADKSKSVFICLVCGPITVCALNRAEFTNTIDLSASGQQWIRIDVPKNGSCRVSGSAGSLKRRVPHNSFPDKVFV